MPEAAFEERLAALEAEVAEIKARLDARDAEPGIPWWKRISGTFANDPEFEEAMRLGREYRESLRPPDYEDSDEQP